MSIELSFIGERNPGSLIICAYTWSKVSHVDIVIPGQGYFGARPKGGVSIRPFDYIHPHTQIIGTLECSPRQEAAMMKYAYRQIGKPYDWLNILGISLHQDWTQEPNKWICTVLAWAVVHAGSIDLVNPENQDRPTAKDLMESPLLTLRTIK